MFLCSILCLLFFSPLDSSSLFPSLLSPLYLSYLLFSLCANSRLLFPSSFLIFDYPLLFTLSCVFVHPLVPLFFSLLSFLSFHRLPHLLLVVVFLSRLIFAVTLPETKRRSFAYLFPLFSRSIAGRFSSRWRLTPPAPCLCPHLPALLPLCRVRYLVST